MATYEYINSEGDYENDISLEPQEIVDGLSDYEKREVLSLLLSSDVSVSQFEFQHAIKKMVLNYHQLSQHEESFIINTSKRF
jgi:hypothetical protein